MQVYYCKKFNTVKNGFTLVEILVVIAIMSILAAITLPVFFNMRTNDRKSTCASNMEAMGRALTEYYQDYKKYPAGARPDYAMKVWANTADAYQAIPLSNQPNSGVVPLYDGVTIPPMNPTTGTSDLLCYPRSSLKQQYKVTVQIVSGPTFLNPALPYLYNWNCTNGSSGTGTVTTSIDALFDTIQIKFSSATAHTVGETWEFYTFVADNMKLGGASSNPYAKTGIIQLRYTITIQTGSTSTAPLTQNSFTWSAADSKNSTNILETGGPTTIQANTALPLSNGLFVKFDDECGHYVGDNWTFITVEAPFDANASGTCTWMDWRPRGTAQLLQTLNAGSTTATVSTLMPFDVPCQVTIRDASNLFQTTARIINVTPNAFPQTVTFDNPISLTFATNSIIDPGRNIYHLTQYAYMTESERRQLHFISRNYTFENYGLSYLYYQYLLDKGIYLRSMNYLHCPTDIKNDRIDRTIQITKLQAKDLKDRRLYDPLQAGYNKYDFTYNYDQYINDITAFDTALGYGPLHIHRQLYDARPPADTVVSWCFQHRTIQPSTGPYYFNTEANTFLSTDGKTYITPDGQPVGTPIAGVTSDQLADAKMAEYAKQRDVVLWLDGSSGTVKPQIVKSTVGRYYWLPTFLTSSAEQR